jgi:hypothetical protein
MQRIADQADTSECGYVSVGADASRSPPTRSRNRCWVNARAHAPVASLNLWLKMG